MTTEISILLCELWKNGFPDAEYDEEYGKLLPLPREVPEMEIRDNFVECPVSVREEKPHILPYYESLRAVIQRAREIQDIWNNAPQMEIGSIANYRIMDESEDVVLAARVESDAALHYVVWEYTPDRSGVQNGDYSTDYDEARRRFEERAGISLDAGEEEIPRIIDDVQDVPIPFAPELPEAVSEHFPLSPDEAKQLHDALVFRSLYENQFTQEGARACRLLMERLETAFPALSPVGAPR